MDPVTIDCGKGIAYRFHMQVSVECLGTVKIYNWN